MNFNPLSVTPSLNPKDFALPPGGLSPADRNQLMMNFSDYIATQKSKFIGYQADQKLDYEDTKYFLDVHVNNIGDPFTPGNFTLNSKVMESAVLDYYAKLWNAKLPHDPDDPESYWGYVLSMGSSEGNIYGLWNARDYLAGKRLMRDIKPSGRKQVNYKHPLPIQSNENAYTPIAFFSEDTHYSITKFMRVLQIPTYDEIGNRYYPDQNPVTPDGKWSSPEVPSLDGKMGPGTVDIEKLATLVEFFASRGYPILVICNYGTTFKGAYDNVEAAGEALMPVFKKYGLVDRTVHYDDGTDIRNGYWIHVDGALGASYMPFIEMAYRKQLIPEKGPVFDFRLEFINSLVMSGHKWPGASWPCGVLMTKVKYQLAPPDDPEYIGSPDTTFSGSRNGFSSILLWDFLAKNSYDQQIKRAMYSEGIASYAYDQLIALQKEYTNLDLKVARSPLSLTVRFRKPNDKIVFKYSLSCETLNIDGKDFAFAHLYAMPSVTRELVDAFIDELKNPGAFDETSARVLAREQAGK